MAISGGKANFLKAVKAKSSKATWQAVFWPKWFSYLYSSNKAKFWSSNCESSGNSMCKFYLWNTIMVKQRIKMANVVEKYLPAEQMNVMVPHHQIHDTSNLWKKAGVSMPLA